VPGEAEGTLAGPRDSDVSEDTVQCVGVTLFPPEDKNMKISGIRIRNFKRFSSLTVSNISPDAKLILLVGPNGSGKSSLFDALMHWYRSTVWRSWDGDAKYCRKELGSPFDWQRVVDVDFHDSASLKKNSFYLRSAYRNEPDFNVESFSRTKAPYEVLRVNRTIQNDQSVAENYTRLVHATLEGVYSERNNGRLVSDLREELIGAVRRSMIRVFDDLVLNNISDPLGDGSFYFQKGTTPAFHYKNLSGGEKAAFDLLLDLLIKLRHYDDTIFCIDEPEMHMHTRLQAALTKELVSIIPDNSQLWLATHSLGVMRAAKELQAKGKNVVCVLDFGGANFDDDVVLKPTTIDRVVWEKFLSIAVDDLSTQFVPRIVVICEGSSKGERRKDFDAEIYNRLFGSQYPDILFVSGGSSNELTKNELVSGVLRGMLKGSKILSIVDRDDRSPQEVEELRKKGILSLTRRNLESYLFDDEVLTTLASSLNQADKSDEVLKAKADAVAASVKRDNPEDDMKSAAGDTYVAIKRILRLNSCGNSRDAFMRDTLAPLVSPDLAIYRAMESDIIRRIEGMNKINP
jgi:predicted ATPase